MPKMPCHISDGPQTPEDQDELYANREIDEDEAYETWRADQIDRAHAMSTLKERHTGLHTKISKYTKTTLYSYDQAYWWSTEETAWKMHKKIERMKAEERT